MLAKGAEACISFGSYIKLQLFKNPEAGCNNKEHTPKRKTKTINPIIRLENVMKMNLLKKKERKRSPSLQEYKIVIWPLSFILLENPIFHLRESTYKMY